MAGMKAEVSNVRIKNRVRTVATLGVLALVAVLLPFGTVAQANHGVTLDVEPEVQSVNPTAAAGNLVTLTATVSAPVAVRAGTTGLAIDWENENGSNDGDRSSSHSTPDQNCQIFAGTTSCSISYRATTVGGDTWRAWIDHDQTYGQLVNNPGNATVEADLTEGRDENSSPGTTQPDLAPHCPTSGGAEPDCTDVVRVNVGYLEVAPDVQTVDAGTSVRMTARLFGPAQDPEGVNIDWENENGPNDPDASTSRGSPDATCTVPVGQRECFVDYTGVRGTDQWRVWVDEDRQSPTVEADTAEGRYAGSSDCQQPEDPGNNSPCAVFDPVFGIATNPTPGNGCNFNQAEGDQPDDREQDCTDVVAVSFRSGPGSLLDCDDQAGTQGQDTERETNPPSNPDPTGADPATEEYLCRVTDQFGGSSGGVLVKGEVENGINDPDPQDGISYDDPDYRCTTASSGGQAGNCRIFVTQNEAELGTAEICFWVGTAADGQSLCADEPTGENQQQTTLTDTANDLADQVEKTWENPANFRLDCEPETDTNPAGTAHVVTCTVTSPSGAKVGGVAVDSETTGAGDADSSDSPVTPEFGCTTGGDGTCSYTHTSTAVGTTTYRNWIDTDGNNATTEADATEARDETAPGGAGGTAEPDRTDVTQKVWGEPPTTVVMTPESDQERVGACNPYTITVTDRNGAPVPNAVIDVEQRHALADNQTNNDEPTVGFCEPPASGGPNPSNVDESKGDRGGNPNPESPDNPGTAGGETTQTTDQNGKVTIGIKVAPGNGSSGSGTVTITAWFETDDNDDPGSSEAKDTSTKTWTPSGGGPGVPAAVSLGPPAASDDVGDQRTYTATVNDANGDPVAGATVSWTEDGEGEFVSQETETDGNGQARATVTSDAEGTQTITVSVADCAEGANCADSSQQTWEEEERATCPGRANDSRNHIVGTSGPDILNGTNRADVICGLGGNDVISGRGGNDLLLGGGGDDRLSGNGGNDTLKGGPGDDKLNGGGGNDRLVGGSGNDELNGGTGRDRCKGGRGRDRIRNCE